MTNQWNNVPSWGKTYASQTNILHWCDEQSTLYLGLDSGRIHRYVCEKEKNLMQMKELSEITVHNTQQRIMGISIDSRVNYMFSISESGYLIVTDLNDTSKAGGKYINSQRLGSNNQGLKAMIHDHQRNVLFIADGGGAIYIMNCIPTTPQLVVKIETDQKVCIRGLTRSINNGGFWLSSNRPGAKTGVTQNYLLAADIYGYITIFDIGGIGKEKNTKRIGST